MIYTLYILLLILVVPQRAWQAFVEFKPANAFLLCWKRAEYPVTEA